VKRREVQVFSLSFLDCISCGFGAVILLFVIINARSREVPDAPPQPPDLRAEVSRIERQVLEGRKNLWVVTNARDESEKERKAMEGRVAELIQTLASNRVELARFEAETLARTESINKLKADVKSREEEKKRMEGGAKNNPDEGGDRARVFAGDGDRHYLTGLKMGGDRILILLDDSASMLAASLVDIIRLRNMDPARQRNAPKWRRAVRTTDWLLTQLPLESKFQVIFFNETARPVLADKGMNWLEAGDSSVLGEVIAAVEKKVPEKGTSLHNAFRAMAAMNPPPDNIFLITDGLPTMAERPGFRSKVSGGRRLGYFDAALAELSPRIPINVILFPMEGDPLAASAFWRLIHKTKGSMISPAEDWP